MVLTIPTSNFVSGCQPGIRYLGGVDGITLVMTEAVLHERYQIFVYPTDVNLSVGIFHLLFQDCTVFRLLFMRRRIVAIVSFTISRLVFSLWPLRYKPHLPRLCALQGRWLCSDLPRTASRVHCCRHRTPAGSCLQGYSLYNQRNQFFREVIRAVVIGTAGNGDRHFVGIMMGHHHHIGTGLGSAVRAVRTQRGLLREEAFRSQRTVNLVRRYLMIAHSVTPGRIA